MKTKSLILGTVITAGAASLTGAQAHSLGTTDNILQVSASAALWDQVADVNQDYKAMTFVTDPLQTVCGINCYCEA